MLGEVNLTHTTSAEQALNNVAGEDLAVVQRHARKPTNDKANAYKVHGHQKARDSEGLLAPITGAWRQRVDHRVFDSACAYLRRDRGSVPGRCVNGLSAKRVGSASGASSYRLPLLHCLDPTRGGLPAVLGNTRAKWGFESP